MTSSCVAANAPSENDCCASALTTAVAAMPSSMLSRSARTLSPVCRGIRASSNKIKIIATDLDGTFLNANHEVSYRNAAAFKAAKDLGYTVLVATGRSRVSAVSIIGEERLRQMDYLKPYPAVFMNGMVVYGTNGEILYEHAMTDKQLKCLVQLLRDEGKIQYLVVYEGHNIWCQEYNEYTATPYTVHGETQPRAVDGDISEKKCSKAVLCAPDEVIVEIRQKIIDKFGDVFDSFYALPQFLELVPKGANKMIGMSYLLKSLDADPSCVMAIGDSENDCAMLRGVGYPIAVKNGCSAVKEIAELVVASNNEDPFAEAVEKCCNIVV